MGATDAGATGQMSGGRSGSGGTGGRGDHRIERRGRGIVGGIATTVAVGLIGTVSLAAGLSSPGPVTAVVPAPAPAPAPPAATTAAAGAGPAGIVRPVVVLYGDSLAWEAQEHFVAAFASEPQVQVVTRTFGGTAICDFLDLMRTDALKLQPGAVVVEFSGNAFTPCMMDGAGRPLAGAAYAERYRSNAEAVLGIFGPMGAHVYFAGAPIPRPADGARHFNGGRLNGMYQRVAAAHPTVATFVGAGASVLDHGRWTATLPCLATEPCRRSADGSGLGVESVRAPDGDHFCPAAPSARAGVTGSCAVWSSGAYRYGRAMAAPVLLALDAGRT